MRKPSTHPRRALRAAVAGLALSGASAAQAALGEPAASVENDAYALSAVSRGVTANGRYSVHALESGGGTIREFAAPGGRVFAVAWSGMAHPDLHPLLGSYAAEYDAALQRTPRTPGRRYSRVKGERIVVEKWGHMRDLHGRAWIPSLVPSSVKLDEIR